MRFASLLAILVSFPAFAQGGMLTPTASPSNAWEYFERSGVGQGNDIYYVPLREDWGALSSQGFVEDDAYFGPMGSGDEDTLRVFTTYVYTATALSVPIFWGHDDGGALYVNGSLVWASGTTAGPAGIPPYINNLNFSAGWNFIEMSVYNGQGASSINLSTDQVNLDDPLSAYPGLTMSATVPEANAVLMVATAAIAGGLLRRRCRCRVSAT